MVAQRHSNASRTPRKRRASAAGGGKKLRKSVGIVEAAAGSKLRVDGSTVSRTSGIAHGACFWPVSEPYVEVEVLTVEPGRTNTLALGFTPSLPRVPHELDKASALPEALLLGYDLPRVCVDGKETRLRGSWRPLKDLKVGDRLGVHFDGEKLTAFHNGAEVASVAVKWSRVPAFGCVDVHGHVQSVRINAGAPAPVEPPRSPTPVRQGPLAFVPRVHGTRLKLDGLTATRESGVTFATAFVPLEHPSFEVEILGLEQRSQTLALGFCPSLPDEQSMHLIDKASDLKEALLVGYDLPRVVVDGQETRLKGKWRPLKDLKVGDRLGVSYVGGTLSVRMNGTEVLKREVSWAHPPRFAVLDVVGHVKQVRLLSGARERSSPRALSPRASPVPTSGPSGQRSGATRRKVSPPCRTRSPVPRRSPRLASPRTPRLGSEASLRTPQLGTSPRRAPRLVHIPTGEPSSLPASIRVDGRTSVGRDPSQVQAVLDSKLKPNFISRVHAHLTLGPDGLVLTDNGTVNGTFVNDIRVDTARLQDGDEVVFGGESRIKLGSRKTQPTSQFRYKVVM